MQKPLTYAGKSIGWLPVVGEPGPHKPHPFIDDVLWRRNDTSLWIGIASFRDPLCGQTLHNIFSKAAFPERLHVTIVQQNAPGDQSCLEQYCELGPCLHRSQVHIHAILASEAKGPVHARAIQSNLVPADIEFCMQVDAHMDYVHDWDLALFQFWGQTKNEYAVLTTYVADYAQLDKNINGVFEVPHLCNVVFTKDGNIRNQQAKAARNLVEPKLSPLWAAGLSFSKCHAERVVKNDPYLPHVFDGEEFTRAVRLWTSGYDFYTPPRTVVVHHYNRKILGSWTSNFAERKTSEARMSQLLQMTPEAHARFVNSPAARHAEFGDYGLGDRRSLDQYIAFSGIDCRHRLPVKTAIGKCGSLEYIPFSESESMRHSRLASRQRIVDDVGGGRRLRLSTAKNSNQADVLRKRSATRRLSVNLHRYESSRFNTEDADDSTLASVLWLLVAVWGSVVMWCTYRIAQRVGFEGRRSSHRRRRGGGKKPASSKSSNRSSHAHLPYEAAAPFSDTQPKNA